MTALEKLEKLNFELEEGIAEMKEIAEIAEMFAKKAKEEEEEISKMKSKFEYLKPRLWEFIISESGDFDFGKFSWAEWKVFTDKLIKHDFSHQLPKYISSVLNPFTQEVYFIEMEYQVYALQKIWGQGETIYEVSLVPPINMDDIIESKIQIVDFDEL